MNDPESTEGRALSTEQIAAAGAEREDPPRAPAEQAVPARQAAPGSDAGAGDQPRAQLLEDNELQNLLVQWKDIQAEFVDEPRKAVQAADALVAELMQRLAQMFASERAQLESRWSGGEDVSTEDLRRGLRRYRSFFERLLAA
jgi:alkylhydroperoxidase family enzyme